MESIRNLRDLGKNDISIAGGKGSSLGEMMRIGILVPEGFVILSSVFDRFLRDNGLDEEIDGLLRNIDVQASGVVEEVSQKIRTRVLDAAISDDVAQEIERHFIELDAEYIAVRSSATVEDSDSAAWAGQLDSFLNTGKESILQNIQKCWASLFTPRAIAYRFENNLQLEKVSVAVVVQEMIQSEISGTAFSVHPVSREYNQLVIEAGFGLGEAIVSGQITPDSYAVEKNSGKIIDKNVVAQKRGIFRKSEGGNVWKAIESNKQEVQKLSDACIVELSELVIEIENHFGFPCDIEWTYTDGRFFIVQSRPITVIASSEGLVRYGQVYTRENSLIAIQIWEEHQCRILQEKLGSVVPFSVFDVYDGVAQVYYRENISNIWGSLIVDKAKNDPNFISETMAEFSGFLDELEVVWEQGKLASSGELKKLSDLAAQAWVGVSISYFLPSMTNISEESQDLGMLLRNRSVDFLERTDHVIKNTLHGLYPDLSELVKYISIDEIMINDVPDREILQERQHHYVYFGFNIYVNKSIYRIAQENGIVIEQEKIPEDTEILHGQTAMSGAARGYVRILRKKSEIPFLREGEVLVTAMTTPDYVPAMKKAVAFVTDEGGITCHAAIVAREFGKPCVIGTKVATKVLKTGDYVEVDADKGAIYLLEER